MFYFEKLIIESEVHARKHISQSDCELHHGKAFQQKTGSERSPGPVSLYTVGVYSYMAVPLSHPKISTRVSLADVNKDPAKVSVAYQF